MSLLSRDELRIVLCREKVQLVRIRSRLTRKGWQYSVLDKDDIAFESDLESPWKNALDKLATEILRLTSKPKLVRVVLSNHFLRYAIVDVDQAIQSKAEQVAFVKHRFVQTYGEAAESWELRLDQECPGAPYLASAVDGLLLFKLREIFSGGQYQASIGSALSDDSLQSKPVEICRQECLVRPVRRRESVHRLA